MDARLHSGYTAGALTWGPVHAAPGSCTSPPVPHTALRLTAHTNTHTMGEAFGRTSQQQLPLPQAHLPFKQEHSVTEGFRTRRAKKRTAMPIAATFSTMPISLFATLPSMDCLKRKKTVGTIARPPMPRFHTWAGLAGSEGGYLRQWQGHCLRVVRATLVPLQAVHSLLYPWYHVTS